MMLVMVEIIKKFGIYKDGENKQSYIILFINNCYTTILRTRNKEQSIQLINKTWFGENYLPNCGLVFLLPNLFKIQNNIYK